MNLKFLIILSFFLLMKHTFSCLIYYMKNSAQGGKTLAVAYVNLFCLFFFFNHGYMIQQKLYGENQSTTLSLNF